MDNLNIQQQFAASFDGRHLLVLAGAGTGKTRTIIARAKHLIQSGVDPKRILILSFTRKSAAEIVERISSELSSNKAEGLSGSTFHSWCMSIIKNHPHIFPQAEFTLLDEDDQESCFKLLCGRDWKHKGLNDKKIKPEDILQVYSYMANAKCSLTDAIRMKLYDNAPKTLDVSRDNEILKGVISMYFEYKRSRKYIDYDDILLTVSKYLQRNPELRHHISSLYDHILIDEMQDTNPLQYELLASFYENCNLFCVGDDAQSIYGFRGADFKSIHHFTEVVPEAQVCRLTINYRSTQEILDLSNWLLEQSPLKYNKKLAAERGHGLKPEFRQWGDEWEEANDVALTIKDAYAKDGKPWTENLVLSRTMFGLRKVEAALLKHKIPYTIFGGRGIMASRHIRDVVSPMRIISNFLDEIAWSRYLQLWRNVGPVTAAEIVGKVINSRTLDDSLDTLADMTSNKGLQAEIAGTLNGLRDLQDNPSSAVTEAYKIMEPRLKEIYKEEWEWRKEDFPLLKEVAKQTGSIAEFVAEYVLDPKLETTSKDGAKKDDVVRLSTIHSAKGLESDNVYLIGANVMAFPTQRAILNGEDAIEEDRRCLYVALTRARDRLIIYRDIHSIHTVGMKGDRYFFNRLPRELYEDKYIALHYFRPETTKFSKPLDENIYSDFDLN